MAIEMTFEIDEQLTLQRALDLLQANGFVESEQRGRGVWTFHPLSGINACLMMEAEPHPVLAEGLVPPRWQCKASMTFRYSNDYEACAFETMKFARTLASQTPAYFVLSFQCENVYAVRDGKGYREIGDTTATMQVPVE